MNRREKNPYEEGKTAYKQSKKLCSNPYNSNNPWEIDDHKAWEQGWLDAYINDNPMT